MVADFMFVAENREEIDGSVKRQPSLDSRNFRIVLELT